MVSLNRPEERTGGLIPEDFDETLNYRVQLDDLELKQATYAKAKQGEMSLVWHLRVFDQEGTAFLDPNTGDVWDLWTFSNLDTWDNPNTGKKAKARELADAFMGHVLTDDEIDELNDNGWENVLVGKYALGSFEVKGERVNLLKMRPYRTRREPAAQTQDRQREREQQRRPEPAAVGAPARDRRAPADTGKDDDLPF